MMMVGLGGSLALLDVSDFSISHHDVLYEDYPHLDFLVNGTILVGSAVLALSILILIVFGFKALFGKKEEGYHS